MSWLFGYVGGVTPALRTRFQRLHAPPLHGTEGTGHYIQCGGLPATCRSGSLPHGRWMIVGLGFDANRHRCMDDTAWRHVLSARHPALDSLDGHFVALAAKGDAVYLYTDPLGTRTLHYAPYAHGHVFSTRFDWLTLLCGGLEVDYEAFGSHWITFNQLSTRSQVKGLSRLGAGGTLTLSGRKLHAAERLWTCDIGASDRSGREFVQALAKCCSPEDINGVSLGLSGGLDSRLLLALEAPQTHVFGPMAHPDVRIARRIAQGEGIPQRHFHREDWDADTALALLHARSRTTPVLSTASSVLDLHHYQHLRQAGLAVIDGGFGEVARRQFMNRLLRLGKGWKDPAQVLPHIRVRRATVFSPGTDEIMTRGALAEIAQQQDTLPAGVDAENAADLIGVRTRLPNFFGLEQNRLDALATCFMPFAQPSVLRALFQVPLELRRSGRLFKSTIRARSPRLARYPLVKGTTTYAFALSPTSIALWSRLEKKIGRIYRDPRPQQFLMTLKPFVLDLVHSTSVRTYAPYDEARLRKLVSEFYAGRDALAPEVDWWLAFEMWRRVVHGIT